MDYQNVIQCLSNKVTVATLSQSGEYEHALGTIPNAEVHVAWLEASMAFHLRNHGSSHVSDYQLNELVDTIPKRVLGKVGSYAKVTGYGMHAQQGWSVWRFMVTHTTIAVLTLPFFIWWLSVHPGDLQNASIPFFMALTLFDGAVVVADFVLERSV